MESGASFSGRVTFEPDPDRPDLKPNSFEQFLTLEPAGRNSNSFRMVDTNAGVFKDTAVSPGEYFIRMRGTSANWLIKSVIVAGSDRTNRPADLVGVVDDVVVTLTTKGASITGSVKEGRAAVIVFPQDQSQWTGYGFNPPNMRVVDTNTDGTFSVNRLPAGNYLVIAVDPAQRLAWLENGFFNAAALRASQVTVGWGDSKSVSLAIVEIKR